MAQCTITIINIHIFLQNLHEHAVKMVFVKTFLKVFVLNVVVSFLFCEHKTHLKTVETYLKSPPSLHYFLVTVMLDQAYTLTGLFNSCLGCVT